MKPSINWEINEFVNVYQSAGRVHTSWREPLVAYASADDPLFHTLKDVVSPSHAMPKDLLQELKRHRWDREPTPWSQ